MASNLLPPTDSVDIERAQTKYIIPIVSQKQKTFENKLLLINRFKTIRRFMNLGLVVMGIIGVVFSIFSIQLCWNYDNGVHTPNCPEGIIFMGLTAWLTLAMIVLLIFYYIFQAWEECIYWNFSSTLSAFFKTNLWFRLLVEILICIGQPLPYPKCYYLIVWMYFRVYLFFRLLRDFTSGYVSKHKKVDTMEAFLKVIRKDSTRANQELGAITAAKTLFLAHSFPVILGAASIFISAMGYIVHLIERNVYIPKEKGVDFINSVEYKALSAIDKDLYYQTPFVYYGQTVYFLIISMTTVGYGDMTPITNSGKVVSLFCVIMGLIFSATLVGTVTNKLQPTAAERFQMNTRKIGALHVSRRDAAAKLIQSYWRKFKKPKKLSALVPETRSKSVTTTTLPGAVLGEVRAVNRPHIKELSRVNHIQWEMQLDDSQGRVLEAINEQSRDLRDKNTVLLSKIEELLSEIKKNN